MRKKKRTHLAALWIIGIFILLFSLLSGRLIYIQATAKVHDVSLIDYALKQRQTSKTLSSERGKIYDKNGMVLAFDRPTFRVYAVLDEAYSQSSKKPLHVQDVNKTAETLAPLLEMEQNEIQSILQKGIDAERFQVEFGLEGKDLTQDVKKSIESLELPGIYFDEESMRYYPNGMFASHIIGFARQETESEEIAGVTGIEKEKNEMLSGQDGIISYLRDRYNRKLIMPNEVVQEPENGQDIYLTIDQKVQTLLEDVLSEVDEKYSPERVTATVMNSKTGEILAMSNRPSYNPNNPSDVENWYNDVISTPVESGSTYKIFTWAAAIDAGLYNGSETYLSGRYTVNPKVQAVNDHNRGKGWGRISYDEGFARSSNVAASKLMWEKLGSEKYLEYLQRFDLDEKTGIDLPGEVSGTFVYDYPRDKLSTSFGQASTATPIQQLKAASAIVNEGKMIQPYVIKKIVDSDTGEIIEEAEPNFVGEPISKETASQVIDLLDSVVNSDIGTGRKYQLDDYTLIGKTGTAQISTSDGYDKGGNNNIYSFMGMAPKEDPEIIMLVSITRPHLAENESGSDPVAYIFKNVMENGLHYLDIAPDKVIADDPIALMEMPKVIGQSYESVSTYFEDNEIPVTLVGEEGQIVAASIAEGDNFYSNQRVILLTDQPTMPSVIGWSKRDVIQLASMLNVNVNFVGSGFVQKQTIKAGTVIESDMDLQVELFDPTN